MSWQTKALNKLPNLKATEFLWVHGNILINDLLSKEVDDILSYVKFKVPVQIYSSVWLTEQLEKIVDLTIYDSYIWPGEGGKLIQRELGLLGGVAVSAKRIGYKNPEVEIEPFQPPEGMVAIVDDVVSTGQTAFEIFLRNNLKTMDLACWIMQYPANEKLRCFNKIFSAYLVRGPKGKVPINSISKFINDELISETYAHRFCLNPPDFIEAMNLLREEARAE